LTGLLALLFLICLCLAVEAFFSGSDIAFLSANRAKIFRRAKEKDPTAVLTKSLMQRPELLFSTTVLGTTLAISCSSTLATVYILRHYGTNKEWMNLLLLTPVILIFGEFVPKMFARANADNAAPALARPLYYASIVLYPLTRLLGIYAQILKHIVGESPEKGFFLSREEIKGALPASRGSDVTAAERVLIERILEFSKITVKEMLRPLIDVVAIEENETLREAVRLFNESEHSRIPVYQERIDRIVGVIQGFDCLRATELDLPVKAIMQPAFFVPESKPIDELFLELKTRPMAIAVNEYGGAEGIITMEDVMEEVVGEIEDEYDEPPRLYHQIGENSFIVSARIEVDALSELLRIPLPKDEDYQTLGGFLLKRMQKIPKKWDSTVIDGVEYVVQTATDRSIEEVYIIVHQRPS
jgi:CBS domain containing-hemolysin-like protein